MENKVIEIQQQTIDEKKAYIERIEKKATEENVSLKHAAAKLGCKIWMYNKYKADLKRLDARKVADDTANGKNGTVEKHGQNMPITTEKPVLDDLKITINVTRDIMDYLEKESKGYATDKEIVAQILLHDCIRAKVKDKKV